jgi:hypothetical protein
MTITTASSVTPVTIAGNTLNIDPTYSPTLEDIVDKVFYGVRLNDQTGQASVDKIAGDGTISLPDSNNIRPNDYKSWMWTYNTLQFTWSNGHLIMEVF